MCIVIDNNMASPVTKREELGATARVCRCALLPAFFCSHHYRHADAHVGGTACLLFGFPSLLREHMCCLFFVYVHCAALLSLVVWLTQFPLVHTTPHRE